MPGFFIAIVAVGSWNLHPDYEAILFDFDGVLADTEPIHYECWKTIFDEVGIACPRDRYDREFIGMSDRNMITMLAEEHDLEPATILQHHPRKKEMFRARVADGSLITDDVRSLIGKLIEFRLGVVTSSGRQEIEPVLIAAGIRDRFSTVVYGSDVQNLKPAPDPYLLAGDRLGITRALVVEDSEAGLLSARAAGFDVVHVVRQSEMCNLVMQRLFG